MSAFKPVLYGGTLTPLQMPIRFLNKEKHSNSIGYKVDKEKRTITNIVLLKRGSKGGQSSGSSKRYHSRIQPEFIGRGFNSLHLIPRSFTGLSGNCLNIYASQNINEQMQVTEDELRPIVEEGVKAVGATSMKDMGKVMEYVMPKVKGRADGKAVSTIAKSLFN